MMSSGRTGGSAIARDGLAFPTPTFSVYWMNEMTALELTAVTGATAFYY